VAEFIGPDGAVCGTTSFDAMSPGAFRYQPTGAEAVTLRSSPEAIEIECADGTVLVIDTQEASPLTARYDTDASDCTVEGGGGFGLCASDADCTTDQVCCDVDGTAVCLGAEVCELAQGGGA